MAFTPWVPGMRITSGRLSGITPKFQDWLPQWTTQTGAHLPSYGNAELTCRYALDGDLVVAHFSMTVGSTTNLNGATSADNYWWSLPVPSAYGGAALGWFYISPAANGNQTVPAVARSTGPGDRFYLTIIGGWAQGTATPAGVADGVTPATWATGTIVQGILQYEAA